MTPKVSSPLKHKKSEFIAYITPLTTSQASERGSNSFPRFILERLLTDELGVDVSHIPRDLTHGSLAIGLLGKKHMTQQHIIDITLKFAKHGHFGTLEYDSARDQIKLVRKDCSFFFL
jgi:hypothetical protein